MQDVPNLRIAGPNCNLVSSGDLYEGTWFLEYPDGTFEEITGGVRVVVDGFDMVARDWIVKPPVVSKNKESSVFKAIKLRADRPDEKCQWGPEYYVRINGKQPALLYLGNKSSRNLMSTIRVGGEYVLLPQKRVHGRFTWYVPNVVDAATIDEMKKR